MYGAQFVRFSLFFHWLLKIWGLKRPGSWHEPEPSPVHTRYTGCDEGAFRQRLLMPQSKKLLRWQRNAGAPAFRQRLIQVCKEQLICFACGCHTWGANKKFLSGNIHFDFTWVHLFEIYSSRSSCMAACLESPPQHCLRTWAVKLQRCHVSCVFAKKLGQIRRVQPHLHCHNPKTILYNS